MQKRAPAPPRSNTETDAGDLLRRHDHGVEDVTAAVHKAMVQVNETGTEAAAATGISVGATAAAGRPAVFRADHPFLFLIRDEDTGCIMFMGRVTNPNGR